MFSLGSPGDPPGVPWASQGYPSWWQGWVFASRQDASGTSKRAAQPTEDDAPPEHDAHRFVKYDASPGSVNPTSAIPGPMAWRIF